MTEKETSIPLSVSDKSNSLLKSTIVNSTMIHPGVLESLKETSEIVSRDFRIVGDKELVGDDI